LVGRASRRFHRTFGANHGSNRDKVVGAGSNRRRALFLASQRRLIRGSFQQIVSPQRVAQLIMVGLSASAAVGSVLGLPRLSRDILIKINAANTASEIVRS